MKTLLLVDGSSYLYRAFHALPDLRSDDGQPTGAIVGVVNMLRRLRSDHPADYSACVFDAKGPGFRHTLYAGYKAHRPPMPEELAAQIAPLHAIIRAQGWPLIVHEGVEADDVLGTLARRAAHQGWRVLIASGDKDLAQLVDDRVLLVDYDLRARGAGEARQFDADAVRARFGVPPERMRDYLALVGDSSDNIPGVPKVGPKTAARWLEQYGSLDALLAAADQVPGVVGQNLRAAMAETLPLARQLVAIRCDLDIPGTENLNGLAWQPVIREELVELYRSLGLRRLLAELEDEPAKSVSGLKDTGEAEYHSVLTSEALDNWIGAVRRAGQVSIDTETTGLDEMQAGLVGLSLCVEEGRAAYLPLGHREGPNLDPADALGRLRDVLEDPAIVKLGQNLKFDLHILARHGVALAGIRDDSLLQSYVLESHQPHDMDSLARRHLGLETISYDQVTGTGRTRLNFADVDLASATRYAAEDADVTWRLCHRLGAELARDAGLDFIYRHIEMPLLPVLARMEAVGVAIDPDLLGRQHAELGALLHQEEDTIAELAGGDVINLNSAAQVRSLLFERLGLAPVKKTPGGVASTDEEVLATLADAGDEPGHRAAARLLRHRAIAKLRNTYTGRLPQMINPDTGRIHTRYNQAVAITGRLSSADPNLQNIPVRTPEGRRIRAAFVAAPGCRIVAADYSQIELRIMAHLSGDAGMREAFARGEDIHRATAAEILGGRPEEVTAEERRWAKTVNFGLIYGMSAFGLARSLGIERRAAQNYMNRYFSRYPGVARYMDQVREQARSSGRVHTLFGRRLQLPELTSRNAARRAAAERAAVNAPMQGTAADLIKLAMIAVDQRLAQEKHQARLIMQVHDELVLEVPEAELERLLAWLPGVMTGVAAGRLDVPLEVDVGSGANWDEAH